MYISSPTASITKKTAWKNTVRKILLEIGRDAETARRIGLEQEQQAAVLEDAAFYRNALPRPRRRGLIEPISIILRVPHGRLLE